MPAVAPTHAARLVSLTAQVRATAREAVRLTSRWPRPAADRVERPAPTVHHARLEATARLRARRLADLLLRAPVTPEAIEDRLTGLEATPAGARFLGRTAARPGLLRDALRALAEARWPEAPEEAAATAFATLRRHLSGGG